MYFYKIIIHPGGLTTGTYSHHPWKERKMIWTKPPWGHVPAVNLQGCRILDGGLVIPLIFPKVPPIFEKESLGFPRKTPLPIDCSVCVFLGVSKETFPHGSKRCFFSRLTCIFFWEPSFNGSLRLSKGLIERLLRVFACFGEVKHVYSKDSKLWNLQRAIRQQRKILTVQVKRRNLEQKRTKLPCSLHFFQRVAIISIARSLWIFVCWKCHVDRNPS